MKKNRKPLIALVLVAIIGVVGGTIAYFSNYAVFENIFHTDKFEQEIEEKFVSPSDWRPGDETEKKLEVTNTGTRPVKVAVEVYQEWRSGNGEILNPWGVEDYPVSFIFSEDETCPEYTEKYIFPPEPTPHTLERESIRIPSNAVGACVPIPSSAILNLANGEDWSHYYEYEYNYVGEGNGTHEYDEETDSMIEIEGGSYIKYEAPYLYDKGLFVYNKELGAGETTTSFLDSVTFNPYAVSDTYRNDGLVCDTYYVMEDGTEVLKPEPVSPSSNTSTQGIDEIDMSKVVGQKSKCHSTGDGYSGATYTLYFAVHIMQPEVFDDFVTDGIAKLQVKK